MQQEAKGVVAVIETHTASQQRGIRTYQTIGFPVLNLKLKATWHDVECRQDHVEYVNLAAARFPCEMSKDSSVLPIRRNSKGALA